MTLPPEIPIPALPLEYAMAVPRRPGILTAVGVISIVLGSISVLASLSGVAQGVMYIAMSKMTFPSTVPPAPTTMQSRPILPTRSSGAVVYSYNVTAHSSGTASLISPNPFRNSRGPSILSIIESSLSLCAAVLLIVAGALMLRDSPNAARLHRMYAFMKLPLVAAAGIASWWSLSVMFNNITLASPGTPGALSASPFFSLAAILGAVITAGFALIYPIALLIVLATRSNREYCRQIRTASIK